MREYVQLGTSGLSAVTDAFKQATEAQTLAEGFRDAEGAIRPVKEVAKELGERFQNLSAVVPYFSFRDAAGELGEVSELADGIYATLQSLSHDNQTAFSKALGVDKLDDLYEILDPANDLQWKLKDIIEQADAAAQGDMNVLQSLFPDHEMSEILAWFDGSERGAAKLRDALETVDPSKMTDGFTAAMETLPAFIEDGIGILTEGIPRVMTVGGQILGAVVSGVINNLPALADGAVRLVSSFGKYLTEAAPSIAAQGKQTLDFLVSGIINGLPKLTETAVNLMSGLGQSIRENLPSLLKRGLEIAEQLSFSIRENAGKLIGAGLDLLLNLAQGFADSIPALIEHIPTIISNIAGVINDNAPKVIATGVKIIATLAVGIVKAIPALIANFPKIIQAVVDVWTAFNWLSLGKNVVTFIKNGIQNLKTEIPKTLKSIAEQGKEWFSNIDWKGVGANLLKGIWNGIKDTVGWLKDRVVGVVNTIKNWFIGKQGFDEHSPSKWAERVGEYVSEGLANGIETKASEAEQAAEKMASNIYSGLSAWADRTTKYERLSLEEQLELWTAIQNRFARNSEQWLNAYDKVWDIQEKIASERKKAVEDETKAAEDAEKSRYNQLTSWLDKAVKYNNASYTEQMRVRTLALSAFRADSEQYADIEEQLFDLRLSAYRDYAERVEKISGNLNETQRAYDNAVQKRTEEIANSYKLFDAIPEKQEISGKQLLDNLQGQIRGIRDFYANLESLQSRGVGDALVDEIRSMGVGASGELEALLSLSDRQLSRYAEMYEEKQSLANSIAISELSELGDETSEKIREQMNDLKALYEENAPVLGESFTDGLVQGIRNGFAGVMGAAIETARGAIEKTREILNGGSASFRIAELPTRYDYAYEQWPGGLPAATSAPASGGQVIYPAPELRITAEPAPVIIDGQELARILYQYMEAERNRHGRQLIAT